MGFKDYIKEDRIDEGRAVFKLSPSDAKDPKKVKAYMKEAITKQQMVVTAMKELAKMYNVDIKDADEKGAQVSIKSFARLHSNLHTME